jgi:hypothetical protein
LWTLFGALLLLLLATGCGEGSLPARRAPIELVAGDVFTLVATAVVIALVTYFVVARRGRAAVEPRAPRRVLFAFVVVAVSAVGLLVVGRIAAQDLGRLDGPILWSTLIVAWGAFLLLQFLVALDRHPSLAVARAGALFAVLQVPPVLAYVWLRDESVSWVTKLGGTSFVLAIAAAHATFLLSRNVRTGQRWLVRSALAFEVVLLSVSFASYWGEFKMPELVTRALFVLFVLTVTWTFLAEVCHRGDRPAPEDPPPPAPGA